MTAKDTTGRIEAQDEVPTDIMARAHEASEVSETEKHMSLLEGLKTYSKAVGWSIFLSTALVMDGYDTALVGNLFSFAAFQKKCEKPNPDGSGYNLSAPWKAGLGNGSSVGEIFDLFISPVICIWATEK